ncbi:MAG TPA: hypothetical protein VJA87_01470 [Candidatus Paceibacterota bacterium]
MNIHPILAGVINAIFPGLGYVLIRERLVFGIGLLLAMVLFMFVSFTDPSPSFATVLFAVTPTGRLLESLAYLIAVLAFAYDAYDLARKKRGTAVIKL